MSFLVTADLHFSDNPRDEYRFRIFGQLASLAAIHKPKALLILGDLTEKKDNHGAWLVNRIVAEMVVLASWCPIIILRGNHDGLDPAHPFFEFLDCLRNIRYISVPREFELQGLGNCLFLPHTTDYRRDWPLDSIKSSRYPYIFAHNTFKGATGQHRELDGLPLNIFNKDARVIAGDVHVPHTISPVTYVGSPYLIDFGDDFRPRVLLETSTKSKSIPIIGPQKKLVEANVVSKEVQWPTAGLSKGDILKVRLKVTPKQYQNWAEIKEGVLNWASKHEYVLHVIQPVLEGGGRREDGLQVTRSRMNDTETLEAYGTQRGIDSKVMSRGKKLMEKSK